MYVQATAADVVVMQSKWQQPIVRSSRLPPGIQWPPLSLANKAKTKSYALLLENINSTQQEQAVLGVADAQTGTVHCVVYNIPPNTWHFDATQPLPPGASYGMNDFGQLGFQGVVDTKKDHGQVFRWTIYALSARMESSLPVLDASMLRAKMTGHIVTEAAQIVHVLP